MRKVRGSGPLLCSGWLPSSSTAKPKLYIQIHITCYVFVRVHGRRPKIQPNIIHIIFYDCLPYQNVYTPSQSCRRIVPSVFIWSRKSRNLDLLYLFYYECCHPCYFFNFKHAHIFFSTIWILKNYSFWVGIVNPWF